MSFLSNPFMSYIVFSAAIVFVLILLFGYKKARADEIVILYNLSTWNGIITVLEGMDKGIFYNRLTTKTINIKKDIKKLSVTLDDSFENIIKKSKFESENILFEQRKMFFENLCKKNINIDIEFNYKISEDKKILSCIDKARFLNIYNSKANENELLDNYMKLVILYVLNLNPAFSKAEFEDKLNVCSKPAFERYMYQFVDLKIKKYEIETLKE